MRKALDIKKRKKTPDGPRVWSKQFGGGTITKAGPEQSEVAWDDRSFIPQFVPNSWFDKRFAEPKVILKRRS